MSLLKTSRRRFQNLFRRCIHRIRDRIVPSFGSKPAQSEQLNRLIPPGLSLTVSDADRQAVQLFLEHRFDLLGSGWVKVFHGMNCQGFEGIKYEAEERRPGIKVLLPFPATLNRKNRAIANEIRKLISSKYVPIDWQIDFKSGYRWSEQTWYRDIKYGHAEGADVKVPWELSRAQHLPSSALLFMGIRDEKLAIEFQDQVLDWISANPPRFGVNWACTMDVAIRITNWLVAYDLFQSAGYTFSKKFDEILIGATYDHAWHIVYNLEWAEKRRANHYLADVCGLLISAAYLPACKQTDAWLAFAIQELMVETENQFLSDGGHFEASTSYHRLCGEMIAVSAVFCGALPQSRLESLFSVDHRLMRLGAKLSPQTGSQLRMNYEKSGKILSSAFYDRLLRAAYFTCDIIKPDGTVPQVGDNDSGRFLRFGGWGYLRSPVQGCEKCETSNSNVELSDEANYPMELSLNHQQWLGWVSALFDDNRLLDKTYRQLWVASYELASFMTNNRVSNQHLKQAVAFEQDPRVGDLAEFEQVTYEASATHRLSSELRAEECGLIEGLLLKAYPVFGLYIFRSKRLYMSVRCGNGMQDGSGCHAHADQLTVEISINGKIITADPGTYVYTSSPKLRNAYRSALVHAAPSVIGGGVELAPSVFSAPTYCAGECLYFGSSGFAGKAVVEGGHVVRRIGIYDDRIEIADQYTLSPPWRPASADLFKPAKPIEFSTGYGQRLI